MYTFKAILEIIGINPFVFVPEKILLQIFNQAGKNKGYIPIRGVINNETDYTQTLVRYSGEWRLYINTSMLKHSPNRIGETIEISIQFDPDSRVIETPEKFVHALHKNATAKTVFENLSASKKKEIVRYLANLKSAETLDKNIVKAIDFLLGNGRFVGRDKP